MTKDTVVAFRAPDGFSLYPLTDLLRRGARDLIAQAVEAKLYTFLAAHADQTDASGRRRLVRHGHLPEREVQTGIGAVAVKVPRVRDRAPEGGRLKFTSTILPPYLRRAKSIEELLPSRYLKGISTGDFSEALAVSFQQVVHSGRIGETGVTTLQAFRSAPNEHSSSSHCGTIGSSPMARARLTPVRREEMAHAVIAGRLSKAQAAREYGVSAKIVSRWTERFRAEGRAGMQDRSSRPKLIPTQTADTVSV